MPRVRVATQSAAKVKGLVGGAVFGGGTEGASGPTDDRLGAQGTPVAAVGIGQAHFSVYGRLGEWGRLWSAGHAVLAGMLMLFQTAWQPGGMGRLWSAGHAVLAGMLMPAQAAWQPRRGGVARGRGMRLRPACSCLFRLHGSQGGAWASSPPSLTAYFHLPSARLLGRVDIQLFDRIVA